jgi:hypothetical protein
VAMNALPAAARGGTTQAGSVKTMWPQSQEIHELFISGFGVCAESMLCSKLEHH